MSRPSVILGLVAAAFLTAMSAAPASALTYDKLTYLTFSGPVQIPGATLGAGTYRFRLANPETGRNVIQVLSNDGYYVFAMFHTIPDYRVTTTEESMVTFREVPAGVAPPVKSLFYGGETFGYEFLYGRGEPNLIPPVVPQPPITYEPNVAPVVAAVEPVTEPVPSEPITSAPAVEPVAAPEPALPKTATSLPLVGFSGLASVVVGLGIGWMRRRTG